MKDFKEELAKYGYNLNNSVPVPTLIEQILPEIFKKSLEEAFNAGISFENGEQKSWKTYNKFTGNQQPNKELNFEEWFNKFKK